MTWAQSSLRELGTWYGGGTPSKSNPTFWEDGTIPWLSPKDMGPQTLAGTRDHVTSAAISGSATKLVPSNSVAIVVRSGILERKLPVAVVPFQTTLNQDMKALVPRSGVDVRWVAHGLRAFERELLRETRKAGTTVASIEMPRFLAFALPMPPLAEQRRIVEILEDHLSRLDAAIGGIELAQQRAASLLDATLASLFGVTAGERYSLGDIARWSSGGTPSSRVAAYYEGGQIPWCNSGDLNDAHLEMVPKAITRLGLEQSSAKWVPAGSVLVAMYGATIGRVAINDIPMTTNQAVAAAVPNRALLGSEYLFWFLRSQFRSLRAVGKGGAQPNISQGVLKELPIRVPDQLTQEAVVQAAAEAAALHIRAGQLASNLQRRTIALRRATLTAAFSGRLTGQRRDDEVVEELAAAGQP